MSKVLRSKQHDKRVEEERYTFLLDIQPRRFTKQFMIQSISYPTGWNLVITAHPAVRKVDITWTLSGMAMCPEKIRHSIAIGKKCRSDVGKELVCLPGTLTREQE